MTGLTGLEQLSIDGTTVSDAGLRHLEELTRLKILDGLLKRKNLEGLFTFLAGHYPRYELVINNDVARQKGVSIADAMENLLVIMGGDVQADGTFERSPRISRIGSSRTAAGKWCRTARSCSSS